MKIHTQVIINASPSSVWNILTHLPSYADWNPFIKVFQGQLEVGKQVQVSIHPPQGKAMTFNPIIQILEPEQQLKWQGKLFIKGLFDGIHSFKLTALPLGYTLFEQSEEFTGLLVRFIDFTKTENGFHLMNQALKIRAEEQEILLKQEKTKVA
jgi:hypothetical protein